MATVTGLRRERTQLRSAFKRLCSDIDSLLKESTINKKDIAVKINQLEDKSERLFILDENIRESILCSDISDEDYQEEWTSVELYRDEFTKYRTEVRYYLNSNQNQKEASSANSLGDVEINKNRNFRLPKLEFTRFDGEVKNWIGFWGQFKKIHEDNEIPTEDKILYLVQATLPGSAARRLVESFPPCGENYKKALEQLKNRFARDELLIEVYVRELLSLVLQQTMKNDAGMSLSSLYDTLETQLRSLETLGVTTDKYAAMLYPLVESALPENILQAWERHRTSLRRDLEKNNKIDSNNYLNLLLDFLKDEVASESRMQLARTSFAPAKETLKLHGTSKFKSKLNEKEQNTAATLFSETKKGKGKPTSNCIFCERSHLSQDCLKAQQLTFDERKEIVMKKNGCFACLKPYHNIKRCKMFLRCLICSKKHYPILCSELDSKKVSQKEGTESTFHNKINTSNEVVLTSVNCGTETLLQTILVRITHGKESKIVRALLDSASQKSYISSSYVKEINLQKIGGEVFIQGVFGGAESLPKVHNLYNVLVQSLDKSFEISVSALEQPKICNYLPKLRNTRCIEYLKSKNIIISDVEPSFSDIALLLGADVIGHLLTGAIERIDNDLFAICTHLGWTIIGKQSIKANVFFSYTFLSSSSISDLWSLELLGIRDPSEVKSKEKIQSEVMQNFIDTVTVNKDNRYEVHLPFIEGHPNMLSNSEIAKQRLLSTTKKLISLNRFNDYENVFKEWEELGIIEEIKEGSDISHYLPHHAVIKESSVTTKVRPVFDASAKDKNNVSLNDCLEKGPNLIELIPTILLQFRLGSIGVVSDIKKAFLQISIVDRDRNYLKFLWWENYKNSEIKIFKHCRVVFGISSSPFLLAATILYHLERVPDHLKETASKLKHAFYVDNCITSVKNKAELEKFINESKIIMSSAQFDLRGWVHSFGEADPEITSHQSICPVLGLSWNFKNDTLFCDVNTLAQLGETPKTRRGLLSIANRVFDPIGFTCPVTLVPKILLQSTWKLSIGWDKELPKDIIEQFQNWLNQISWLNFCIVPRMLSSIPIDNAKNVTLHVFCDSSKVAYAACIFIRAEFADNISVQLVQAKSRVAPIKSTITLPRLELMATLIGVRLCEFVKKTDFFRQLDTFYWSDSMVALTWIKTKENWSTFVGNRVKEIRCFTRPEEWFHVPGSLNIADLPSRGCSGKQLLQSQWWNGPEWLKLSKEFWPKSEILCNENLHLEKKKAVVSTVSLEKERFTNKFSYFSKYTKIIRLLGWIFRFYNNVRRSNSSSGELTSIEIAKAEFYLIKLIQEESFGKIEMDTTHNLQVLKGNDGLIRVKTKLLLRQDTNQFKYPILLPYNHEIVLKLIFEKHLTSAHAGVQTLLCLLREEFWILRGRKTVKQVVSKCNICRRHSQKAIETPFAPLPENRMKDASAFEITGMDYAGPLHLKNGDKSWILIFTCAVYRAVHFELVNTLSTDGFILAFRRFIARRGRVSTIYSDNGTSFVSANNLFSKINWDEILKYSSVKRISWIFNAPTAAWWGGWWERIVRITKELLRRNLGKASVNYEEMLTVLCDCEAIINSRPLTYVSENEELVPLMPLHFLQSLPTNEAPDLDYIDRQKIVKRYKYLQILRDGLRTRFRREYLANLIHHGKRKTSEVKVGDVVLLEVDNKKRVNWPLARIISIHPGRDNIARVARIKVNGVELLRPFQRLYPLEMTQMDTKTNQLNKPYPESQSKTNTEERAKEDNSEEISQLNPELEQNQDPRRNIKIITRFGRAVKIPDRYQS